MDSKLEKEEFVSGLEGTTITEIYLITVTLCVGYLLRCCALICFPFIRRKASSSVMVSFLLEYSTTVFPAVLIFTVLADYTTYVLFLELFITGVMISSIYSSSKILSSIKSALSSPFPPRLPFLTLTRTYINLFTAVAILGVDFKIYPRRLAKAELYGAGLMDVGVGSFLMAHGLTSPEAREQGPNIRGNPQRGYFGLIGLTVRHVLPLLVLGFVRLLAVKTLGYQEHVTEYGVHWNFFFTIATVRVLCSLLHPLLVSLPYGYGVIAAVVSTLYQVSLQWGDLESYILLGPNGDGSRRGILSANREGIVSCLGYLAIYTGWIQIGKWLFKPRKLLKDFLPVALTLLVGFMFLWLVTAWSDKFIHPISRRLVNFSYILWIFSYGAMILSTFLFIDLIVLVLSNTTHMPCPPPYNPQQDHASHRNPLCGASAVDYNQLAFFLLANLLTGLVNFSMDTLHASAVSALAVLLLYMATLLATFTLLHVLHIKIKV